MERDDAKSKERVLEEQEKEVWHTVRRKGEGGKSASRMRTLR